MNILQAIRSLDPKVGGPSRAVLDLSRALAARGHDVRVLTLAGGAGLDSGRLVETASGVCPTFTTLKGYRWPFPSRHARTELRGYVTQADVVHLHGLWDPFNLECASLALEQGKPYVVTLRGMLDDWCMSQKPFKKRLYLAVWGRQMLEAAAIVHCTAAAELRQSAQWFPAGRGHVVPNLLDLSPFETAIQPELALARFPIMNRAPVRLLFLGRVDPKKGVEHLLRAAALLRGDGTELSVIIAGAATTRAYASQLRSLAKALRIEDVVLFTGHVGGDLKLSLLRAATLMVSPTSQENFGFTFFEALAAGTPVVTTTAVDTADELVRSGGGFLVEQDAESIAACIRRLISDARRLVDASAAGRAWIMKNLSTDRVAAAYEAMFAAARTRTVPKPWAEEGGW